MEFDDYIQYDATGLAGLIRAGEVSPGELIDVALASIDRLNPALNAVVATCPDEARAAVAHAVPTGPLGGVPYLVKDLNTNVAGLPATNGSRLLAQLVPASDSVLVTRHRAAGLVILGKTNTPEFGLNVCTSPALFGACTNPFDQTRSAGGSSGGSAAAVASGMVPVAHATDSGGSIRIPASNCGLFGLKPTRGLIPLGNDATEGLSGMSTGHAVTHSVRDSRALFMATAGPLPGDPDTTAAMLPDSPVQRVALWTRGFAGEAVSGQCAAAAADAAALCESLGAVVTEVAPPVSGQALRAAFDVVFTANIAALLRSHGDNKVKDQVEPASFACMRAAAKYTASDYVTAMQSIQAASRSMTDFFMSYDVLLTPTLANPARPLGELSMQNPDWDAYLNRMLDEIPFTPLFNATGGPAMSVPLGRDENGVPTGVQFGTRPGGDMRLFSLAERLEQAAPWHDRR